MHKTPMRSFEHYCLLFLEKKKTSLCIHHLLRNMRQLMKWRGSRERGHVMPVFVQVKCEGHWGVLCVRSCGATTESAWGVRGLGLHRLNWWGATAAFLQEWGSAFWANSGVSFKAEEQVRGPVSARLCAAFVESSRTRWRGTIFIQPLGTCTHRGMHSNELGRYFSQGKSCVLMQLYPGRVNTGLQLSVYGFVFVFVFVCQ